MNGASALAEQSPPPRGAAPVLSIAGISKSFASVRALEDFDLQVEPGEVHALAGQNGSGKSTLIKILSGYHSPDAGGRIEIDGQVLRAGSADHAYRLGCRFVHQDLGLIGTLSVRDNFQFGAGFPKRFGTVRDRAALGETREALERVGVELDPREKVASLGAAQRTGVAVARALRRDEAHPAKLLVLDEPTATLPADELDHLLRIVKLVADGGVGVVFVSHHLDEIFEISHRVTVLRDGRCVATLPTRELDRAKLIHLMIGDEVQETSRRPRIGAARDRTPALAVSNLTAGVLSGVDLSVAKGEVVGIAGLGGSGRETLLSAVFGAIRPEAGTVSVFGTSPVPGRPDLSIASGMAYMPADRKSHGAIMALPAYQNLTLAGLGDFWQGLRLRRGAELAESADWFKRLDVRPADGLKLPLSSFSGGNQQKILLAKWLRREPRVFLLDEPTQGVDVAAKAELHRLLQRAADREAAVVVSSSDLEELVAVADRVLVVRHGRIAVELCGAEITEAAITTAFLGEHHNPIKVGE